MNITITLTADQSLLEVLKGLVNLNQGVKLNGSDNGSALAAVVTETEPVKAAKKKKEAVAETPAPSTPTLETIRELVSKKVEQGKRKEMKALLTEFETDSVSNLSAEHYTAFYSKVEAL